MNKTIVALLLTLSLSGAALCTQKRSNESPNQNGKTEKARERKGNTRESEREVSPEKRIAAGRLEAIGERAKELDSGIMKVKILAKVADALWQHNEARARTLFIYAFRAIDAIELDATQDQRVGVAERTRSFGPLFYLRSSVLQLVTRRDTKLAEELRKWLERETGRTDGQKNRQLDPAEKAQMYLDGAVALAKNHPEQAAQLIRNVLRNEINPRVMFALLRMRAEISVLADQLFSEAVNLVNVRQVRPDDIESLSIYVLPTEEELFFGQDPANDPGRLPAIQLFLDCVYAGLSSNSLMPGSVNGIESEPADSEYHTLKNLLPFFDRLQPTRAAFVRGKMAELLSLMTPQTAATAEPVYQESVEELIRIAESTVGERPRTIRFMRASGAALRQGEIAKAVSIAQRIDDLYERKIQTSLVLYQAAMKELRAGELDRAYRYAREIEFLPQRVAIFHRMALKLWNDKAPDRARASLEEIWEWLSKTENSPQKVHAMLKMTTTMAQHDEERGFELLQSTIKSLNSTDFLFKPSNRGRVSVEVHIALDMLDLESSFATLARADLERAFLMARSLTKPEPSLLAQAIVCQQVLMPR